MVELYLIGVLGGLALTPLAIRRKSYSLEGTSIPGFWALAWAEGCVCWAYGLFLYNFLGGKISRGLILMVLGTMSFVAIGRLLANLWKERPVPANEIEATGWWGKLSLVLIVWAAFTAWMQAASLPLYHFDAVSHFGFFGKVLYLEGTYRVPSLYDNRFFHSAPEYPWLIPYLEAVVYQGIGRFNDGLVKYLFFMCWLAFGATAFEGIRYRASLRAALLGTAIVVTLPLFAADNQTQAVSGGVDIAFALMWSWLVLSSVHYHAEPAPLWLRRMILFSVGCAFAKPNGLVVLVIPWILLYRGNKSHRRMLLLGFASCCAILLPWLWTSFTLHTGGYKEPIHWSWGTAAAAFAQCPGMAAAIGKELVNASNWGLFWWVSGIALLTGFWRRRFQNPESFVLAALAIQFLLYVGAYMVFPETAVWWVEATFSRWLIHFVCLLTISLSWAWDRR